jgi:hypothetical protein
MLPEYVRPYVKAQKNDDRDAEAIAEAATRPTMRFIELKDEDQLDIQTPRRARDRLGSRHPCWPPSPVSRLNQAAARFGNRSAIPPQRARSHLGFRVHRSEPR